jgi:hypothetical protein
MDMRTAFTEHPASVGESYGEHMRVSLGFAGTLAVAAGAALIHAVVPALCTKSASTRVRTMYDRINSGARGAAHAAQGTHSTAA